jgi:hypothetical protein
MVNDIEPYMASLNMSENTHQGIALARNCRAALTNLEELAKKAEPIAKLTRAQWRVYGAGLLKAREMMARDREFGRWVRDSRLNTGLARSAEVRSNAMWWAKLCAAGGLKHFKPRSNHPMGIRREYRAVGFKTRPVYPLFRRVPGSRARRSLNELSQDMYTKIMNVVIASVHLDKPAVLDYFKRIGAEADWHSHDTTECRRSARLGQLSTHDGVLQLPQREPIEQSPQ